MDLNLSIVIPTYNKPDFLLELINSLKFNKTDFEVVFSDDNSTDLEIDSIFNYALKNLPSNIGVKIIRGDENLGIAENTNRGIKASSGKYIGLVDADDYLARGAVDFLNKFLTKNSPDWGFTARWDVVNGTNFLYQDFGNQFFLKNMDLKDALLLDMVASHLKFYKKSLFNNVGYFDSNYNLAIDYDMALRLANYSSNYVYINSPLYFHRIADDQSTQKNWLSQVCQANQLRLKYLPLAEVGDYIGKFEDTRPLIVEFITDKNYPKYSHWIAQIDGNIFHFKRYSDFINFIMDNNKINRVILFPKFYIPKKDLLILKNKINDIVLYFDNEFNKNMSWFLFYASYFTNIVCKNPSDAMVFTIASGGASKVQLLNEDS